MTGGSVTQQTTGKMQGGVANLTNAGKGRKKGVPNKVTGQLKDMILQALNEADPGGAVAYLKIQAVDNPTAFLTLVGKVLPLQIAGDKDNPLVIEMTTKEQRDAAVAAAARADR